MQADIRCVLVSKLFFGGLFQGARAHRYFAISTDDSPAGRITRRSVVKRH